MFQQPLHIEWCLRVLPHQSSAVAVAVLHAQCPGTYAPFGISTPESQAHTPEPAPRCGYSRHGASRGATDVAVAKSEQGSTCCHPGAPGACGRQRLGTSACVVHAMYGSGCSCNTHAVTDAELDCSPHLQDLIADHASGSWVWTVGGKKVLDFGCGAAPWTAPTFNRLHSVEPDHWQHPESSCRGRRSGITCGTVNMSTCLRRVQASARCRWGTATPI